MKTNQSTTSIPTLQTCRTQHKNWASELSQSEADIDQLMALLSELPTDTYRSFNHQSSDYTQILSQLKVRIHYVLTDVVCQGEQCATTPVSVTITTCPDPHFWQPATRNSLISNLSAEYNQIKDRCHVFLGELMRLNLI